ncbi:unnamed protein product [Protopolystoma xenopodis]|uniref:Uncharacterized protein n=1 Tax=Protopolystoma xenopodis TaxID=117903 RepID=A0A3S5ATZ6_9PLAT|nr:unnamed protein product [Protopolystoma xenopodis]
MDSIVYNKSRQKSENSSPEPTVQSLQGGSIEVGDFLNITLIRDQLQLLISKKALLVDALEQTLKENEKMNASATFYLAFLYATYAGLTFLVSLLLIQLGPRLCSATHTREIYFLLLVAGFTTYFFLRMQHASRNKQIQVPAVRRLEMSNHLGSIIQLSHKLNLALHELLAVPAILSYVENCKVGLDCNSDATVWIEKCLVYATRAPESAKYLDEDTWIVKPLLLQQVISLQDDLREQLSWLLTLERVIGALPSAQAYAQTPMACLDHIICNT